MSGELPDFCVQIVLYFVDGYSITANFKLCINIVYGF